jgi:hypothetical protein
MKSTLPRRRACRCSAWSLRLPSTQSLRLPPVRAPRRETRHVRDTPMPSRRPPLVPSWSLRPRWQIKWKYSVESGYLSTCRTCGPGSRCTTRAFWTRPRRSLLAVDQEVGTQPPQTVAQVDNPGIVFEGPEVDAPGRAIRARQVTRWQRSPTSFAREADSHKSEYRPSSSSCLHR